MRVGLISDTHNLLRPEAEAFLRGSDHIVHAGDICDERILHALERIAPVTAVRGNNDRAGVVAKLPETQFIRLGEVSLFVIHDLALLDDDAKQTGAQVIVSGHSHRPLVSTRDGVLFINPGSAGPRRFKLPVSAAELIIAGSKVAASIAHLVP